MFYDVSANRSKRVTYSGRKYTSVPFSGICICNIYSVHFGEFFHVFYLFLNKVNDPSKVDNDLNLFSYRAT